MKTKRIVTAPPGQPIDRKAFVLAAVESYERKLTAYALKYYGGAGGDLHAARDAVQFTFLKLCQQSQENLTEKLAPWLYTVCRNRILDDLKGRKRLPVVDQLPAGIDGSPGPADVCERADLLSQLPRLTQSLAESERDVVELWSEGLKPKEIGEVLGRPAGTIRVQLHRAIKTLQQHPDVQHWLERATSRGERQVEKGSGNTISKVGGKR